MRLVGTALALLVAIAVGIVLETPETRRAAADGISITSITPDRSPAGGEVIVVIEGTGFPDGAAACPGPVIDIKFGAISTFPLDPPTATSVRVVSPTVLPPGPVEVTVTNHCDGTSDTITYTYLGIGLLAGSIPEGGGFGLIVFGGGTNAELVEASGCPEATATFWATSGGDFVPFIPGAAVDAVNDAWNELFGGTIPYNTALAGRCF